MAGRVRGLGERSQSTPKHHAKRKVRGMSQLLNSEEFYTIEDLSREIEIATATLQRWRGSNKGPSFYRIGKNIK